MKVYYTVFGYYNIYSQTIAFNMFEYIFWITMEEKSFQVRMLILFGRFISQYGKKYSLEKDIKSHSPKERDT